jgi:uncharacterized membrane protein
VTCEDIQHDPSRILQDTVSPAAAVLNPSLFEYFRAAVQIIINWVLYYISINIKKKDNVFLMVRKISTVAALSLACLMSAVHSWKYQGHYLGKSDARKAFL